MQIKTGEFNSVNERNLQSYQSAAGNNKSLLRVWTVIQGLNIRPQKLPQRRIEKRAEPSFLLRQHWRPGKEDFISSKFTKRFPRTGHTKVEVPAKDSRKGGSPQKLRADTNLNNNPTGEMAAQPTLSFSRETFAKLSPRPYLLAHLQNSTRANGRSPTECRKPHVNNGSLTHADGSAVVRIGDTTVVCGIRGEILLASDQKVTDVEDLLVPNIELATGCSPAFLPGQPPSTLAQSLSTRVYSLLHSMVSLEDLKIGEEAFWVLYIDILFISLDGNAFDAAWAGAVAALRDVNLPKAHWDDGVICEGYERLPLKGLPMALSFGLFGEWVLSDPDTFEEGLCDSVTVVVDGDRILGISGGAGKERIKDMVKRAKERWVEWKAVLENTQ